MKNIADIKDEYRDSITGGGNEAWLKEMYDTQQKQLSSSYVFIDMNIKRFQYMNNKYGRTHADHALKHLYDITSQFLSEQEYIARICADDYNLLLHYDTMKAMFEKFLIPFVDAVFDDPDPLFFHNIYLSFGFYFLEQQPCDFYEAQNRAQIARKECPQLKRRTFSYDIYHADMFHEYIRVRETAEQVTRARFAHEFIPYVQPKIRLCDEAIVGGEVLLRWQDHEGNLIPLSSFLPVLNANGDIYMVDLNLFDTVCAYLHTALADGEPVVPMSFNITNTSLFDEDFLHDYLDIFHKYNINEQLIEFEFMENIRFDYYDQVKDMIDAFKQYGFTCSLDDFGSGYSSFNILLENLVDILKIDKMFFEKPLDDKNKSIIQHIVEIAHTLNMQVLAEGIETKECLDFLKEIGCDMVQGYYYYKPMPLHDFHKLIKSRKSDDKA